MARPVSYNGNPNLKSAHVNVEWTEERIGEYIKCKNDPIYFIQKFIKIVTVDHGVQPMVLFEYQKDIVLSLWKNRKTAAIICRQAGKTTVVAAFVCWYILFNNHKTAAILANKAATAREILGRVQFSFELLPSWLQQGVIEWNKGSFELENGSKVMASSTSSSAIRGFSVSMLLMDEYAFVPNNIAEEFFASVYPTIASGKESKIAVISTPNGMNHFYKLVKEAEAGTNGFHLTRAVWSDVPGRDAQWEKDQRSVLKDAKFEQEMNCQFIGASNTLIAGSKLNTIPVETPIAMSETMRIYSEPVPGHSYVMPVDTARGTGNDFSAFTVIDVTTLPYTVEVVFADNAISPLLFPGIILNIARKYNNAQVLVETNDIGESIATALYHDYEYEETIMSNSRGDISAFGGDHPGLRTTRKTKSVGCSTLKTLIENDQLIIKDADILYQLSNFSVSGSSYAAENGNDDLAMTLVLLAYLTTQPAMAELTSEDAKQRIIALKQKMIEDEVLPIGFLSDGSTEPEVFDF